MKVRHLILFSFFLILVIHQSTLAQFVTIPDVNLRNYLKTKYPTCFNAAGQMDTTRAAIVNETNLDISVKNIYDFTGVQYFDNLTSLYCGNNHATSLPKLQPTLQSLVCGDNDLTNLPELPSSLTYLSCWANELTNIPTLPTNLVNFYCGRNHLTTLPSIPATVTSLYCEENQLTTLPVLPLGLMHLNCMNNMLTSLPALPGTLQNLICNTNQLTQLPALPATLQSLYCGDNILTSIPLLPSSLIYLYCEHNQISSLPPLPSLIQQFICTGNQLSSIPELPASLGRIYCDSNNLHCLPILPNNLNELRALSNKIRCLPNFPPHTTLWMDSYAYFICDSYRNQNNCLTTAPIVSGHIFFDVNSNGVKDGTDYPVPLQGVRFTPNYYYLSTDSNGFYSANVDTANYLVFADTSQFPNYHVSPENYNIHLSAYNTADSLNDFALQPVGNVNDLEISITSLGRARPGNNISFQITYRNVGTTTQDAIVRMEFDSLLVHQTSSPIHSSSSQDTLTWDLLNLRPAEEGKIIVNFSVPTQVNIDSFIVGGASIIPALPDKTPLNNVNYFWRALTNSFDPNFKEDATGNATVSLSDIYKEQPFTFTVHFQNTGTDTAYNVSIKDTISGYFNRFSVKTIASSHYYRSSMSQGVYTWTFPNIYLPDSTTNEPASHGFIKYLVKPQPYLFYGDQLKNTAYIFFDYNQPVKTNTTVTTVAMVGSVYSPLQSNTSLLMVPNPSKDVVKIEFRSPLIGRAYVKILSIDGREIFSNEVEDTSVMLFDLSSCAKGLYIVQVITKDQVVTGKLVLE
jgi:uncharacterized repeat protein (TIGR01451 family)